MVRRERKVPVYSSTALTMYEKWNSKSVQNTFLYTTQADRSSKHLFLKCLLFLFSLTKSLSVFFPLYVLRKASHNKSVTYSQRLSLCLCVAEKNHHVSRFPSFTLKITNYYMHKRPLVENLAQVSHSLLSSYFRRGVQVYLTAVRGLLGP